MPPTRPRWPLARIARPWGWLLALALAPLGSTARGDEQSFRRTEDVIYGRRYGMALTMDVFRPKANANGVGVIVIISGGWISLREHISPEVMDLWTRRGYTVFAVVHASQPRFTIPDAIEDVNRATRFVRTHAADYGVDPDRLGACGWSAGGQLALMLGTAGGPGNPSSSDPVERASSRVSVVGCFHPPTDFLNFGRPGEEAIGSGTLRNYASPFDFERLVPGSWRFERITDPEQRRAIARSISPINHVTPDDAPTLFIHGDADQIVPLQQSEIMVDKLKKAGVDARLVIKPGLGHGWLTLEPDFNLIMDWFDAHLGIATRPETKPGGDAGGQGKSPDGTSRSQ